MPKLIKSFIKSYLGETFSKRFFTKLDLSFDLTREKPKSVYLFSKINSQVVKIDVIFFFIKVNNFIKII